MKKCPLLIALLALLMPALAMADNWKVVEKSSKSVPAWVKEIPEDCLLVNVESPSLQEARDMAERMLLQTIIRSVATNVSYSARESAANVFTGDDVDTREEFKSEYELAAARLPFIKGVSLSEGKQYWERRENKKTKQNLYFLTVRYPFPQSELTRLRSEFEAYDKEKMDRFNSAKASFDTVDSRSDVEKNIATLQELQEYFFDSVRLKEAQALQKRYRDIYKGVYMESERVGADRVRVLTKLNGRPFRTESRPEVTSDCANGIKTVPLSDGAGFDITFSTEDCLEGELNTLSVSLRIGSSRISTKINI